VTTLTGLCCDKKQIKNYEGIKKAFRRMPFINY